MNRDIDVDDAAAAAARSQSWWGKEGEDDFGRCSVASTTERSGQRTGQRHFCCEGKDIDVDGGRVNKATGIVGWNWDWRLKLELEAGVGSTTMVVFYQIEVGRSTKTIFHQNAFHFCCIVHSPEDPQKIHKTGDWTGGRQEGQRG